MDRDRDRMYDTRSSASGAGTSMDEDTVIEEAPAAADINLPLRESAPVNAPDPRELDGGVEPDRGSRTSAMADAGVVTAGTDATSSGAGATSTGTTYVSTPSAGSGSGIGMTAADNQPIALVREGMKVVDAAGDEIGKVDFVKMGDPDAIAVNPADSGGDGGLLNSVADVIGGRDADDLPETLAGEMLRVGYIRVDTKGWFSKDRLVPADAISGVTGDTVQLSLTKDELVEA